MLMGIKFIAKPSLEQATILSSWMGSAKTIWNAKCAENKYEQTFARKYLPIKTYPKVNQEYSQYKNKESTPWLFECPSQILRNSATNWFDTYQKSLKGICGRPQIKKKNAAMSILLTREVFKLEKDEASGKYQLFIGIKTNNMGILKVNFHKKDFTIPNSIRITKNNYGKFYVSFCYDKKIVDEESFFNKKEYFKYLQTLSESELALKISGFDRGVNVAVAGNLGEMFDYEPKAKRRIISLNEEIKKLQKRIKNKKPKSIKTKNLRAKIAKKYDKQAAIRNDFAHKTSRSISDNSASVNVWEDLKITNMIKKPKVKTEIASDGKIKYLKNKAAAKAGLNAAILNIGWNKIFNYVEYKSYAKGKVSLKVSAKNSSRECAECGHIQPENRNGIKFLCKKCDHIDHADSNAAKVLQKRAIKLILHSGTELSEKGVLRTKKVANKLSSDIGHRAKVRPKIGNDLGTCEDMSKKIRSRKTA